MPQELVNALPKEVKRFYEICDRWPQALIAKSSEVFIHHPDYFRSLDVSPSDAEDDRRYASLKFEGPLVEGNGARKGQRFGICQSCLIQSELVDVCEPECIACKQEGGG